MNVSEKNPIHMTKHEEEQMQWYQSEAEALMYVAVHVAVEAEECFQKGMDKEGNKKLDELDYLHARARELDARLAKDMQRWAATV